MDKDRVKGKMDDVAGRAKRQVGEWTGDSELQTEGAAQQVKGKVENAWGKAKDAVRDAADDTQRKPQDNKTEQEIRDDQRRKDVA